MNEAKLDPDRARDALAAAATAVFGDMAFMDAELVSAEAEGGNGEVKVAVDVLQPVSCRLELSYPRELADRIADTLYGEGDATFGGGPSADDLRADRSRDDSALEILNVLAGSFLSAVFGAGTPFKLELPFFVFGESNAAGPLIARVDLDVEGSPASLSLRSIRYRY